MNWVQDETMNWGHVMKYECEQNKFSKLNPSVITMIVRV